MRIELHDINSALRTDAKSYVAQCDALYNNRVGKAADLVVNRLARSRVVLLAGPSSSGKTTTASRVRKALEERGVFAHMISLDDYYRSKAEPDFPRTRDGELDLEAPRGWTRFCWASIWRRWTGGRKFWFPISISSFSPRCRRSSRPCGCMTMRWSSSRASTA